jgi:hypothetical protein
MSKRGLVATARASEADAWSTLLAGAPKPP